MRLDFRQGIIRSRAILGVPDFLNYNTTLSTIDINITDPWLIVTAAFREQDYLIEERGSQSQVWGPFSWKPIWGIPDVNPIYQLYWDVNTATGEVTKNYTPFVVVTSNVAPISPRVDQHWFNPIDKVMYVWDSVFWQVKCRVFAGSFGPNTQVIIHRPFRSQAGLNTENVEAGYILYGEDAKGIRILNGSFLTSTSNVRIGTGRFSSPIKLETASTQVLAAQVIPPFHCITNAGLSQIVLADPSDVNKLPIGISETGGIIGTAIEFISEGILYNDQWNWDLSFGKDLYCSSVGSLVQGAPNQSSGTTKIGTILSSNSIQVKIDFSGTGGGASIPSTLQNDVTVIGTNVGAIDEGFTFLTGTTFTQFVDLVSKRTIPALYVAPAMSIVSVPTPGNIEVGTVLSPVISRIYSQNDGGSEVSTNLDKNSVSISSIYPHTDSGITLGTSSVSYSGSTTYSIGPIKNNNRGNPSPIGQIQAGTVNSNSITFIGSRQAFFGTSPVNMTTSAQIRSLVGTSFALAPNTTLSGSPIPNWIITIPTGAVKVVFAYPDTIQAVSSVRYQELSDSEIKGIFVQTIVSVEGANGFTPVNYRVYTYTPVEPFDQTVHYKVFI